MKKYFSFLLFSFIFLISNFSYARCIVYNVSDLARNENSLRHKIGLFNSGDGDCAIPGVATEICENNRDDDNDGHTDESPCVQPDSAAAANQTPDTRYQNNAEAIYFMTKTRDLLDEENIISAYEAANGHIPSFADACHYTDSLSYSEADLVSFFTDESNTQLEMINLGSPFRFTNNEKGLILGNFGPLADSATLCDYGYALINARNLGDRNPFECSRDAQRVYFRNIYIQTNKAANDIFNSADGSRFGANDSRQCVFGNGTSVRVCQGKFNITAFQATTDEDGFANRVHDDPKWCIPDSANVNDNIIDNDGDGFCEGGADGNDPCWDPRATPGDPDDTNKDVVPEDADNGPGGTGPGGDDGEGPNNEGTCQPLYCPDTDGDGYGDANQARAALFQALLWLLSMGKINDFAENDYPDCVHEIRNGDVLTISCDGRPAHIDCDDTDPRRQTSCNIRGADMCDDEQRATRDWVRDVDGDLSGDPSGVVRLNSPSCTQPGDQECIAGNSNICIPRAQATDIADCEDRLPEVNPSARENCDTTDIDDNCNGQINEGCAEDRGADVDNDGTCPGKQKEENGVAVLDESGHPVLECNDPSKDVGDCDDNNAEISPRATEQCGQRLTDFNCDENHLAGGLDPACYQNNNADDDGDGFCDGEGADVVCFGTTPEDPILPGDCDDNPAPKVDSPGHKIGEDSNPEAAEVCGNELDEDCSGSADACLGNIDADGGGFCDKTATLCELPLIPGDCNDSSNPDDHADLIHPQNFEICDDGVDNDCDEGADSNDAKCNGDPTTDDDDDGFCESDHCDDGSLPGDCHDGDGTINENAEEMCDGFDNNCNGETDEGLPQIDDGGDDDVAALKAGIRRIAGRAGARALSAKPGQVQDTTCANPVVGEDPPEGQKARAGGCGCDMGASRKPLQANALMILFGVVFIGLVVRQRIRIS